MPLDQPADHNQWWELGNNYIKLYSHDDSIGCQQCWDNDVSGIAAKSKALIMYIRHEICHKFYTAGFSGQNTYTLIFTFEQFRW